VSLTQDALFPGFPQTDSEIVTRIHRPTYGFNAKLQYENTKLVGELWNGNVDLDPIIFVFMGNPVPLSEGGDVDLEGSFVELSHRFDKITPYVRYEDQLTSDVEYTRITAGVNYKPNFTNTLKFEYMYYDHESGSISGLVSTYIYSF
jgi:hypothetical protein